MTAAVVPLLVDSCAARPLPLGSTEQSGALHATWIIFFWVGLFVAVVVYTLIAWCLLRYRKRPGDEQFPPQFRRNDRMEIFYTVVPFLAVCGLFAISYPAERATEMLSSSPAVVVDVTGFRWSWRFDYPQARSSVVGSMQTPPELVLPVNTRVRLNVTSVDVDHSFWVPAFLFKRDALPGVENVFDWTPTQLGTFRGECGEYCGLDHATMSFVVRVVERSTFDRWLRLHRAGASKKVAQR